MAPRFRIDKEAPQTSPSVSPAFLLSRKKDNEKGNGPIEIAKQTNMKFPLIFPPTCLSLHVLTALFLLRASISPPPLLVCVSY